MSQATSLNDAAGAGEQLTVHVRPLGRHRVVSVAGELDLATAPLLSSVLRDVLAETPGQVVLDLDEVRFIDSVGLGVLVATHRRIASCSSSLVLVCNNPRIRKILEITQLTRVFTFAASPAAVTEGQDTATADSAES